ALLALSLAALRFAPGPAVLLPALLAVFCVMPMTSYDWVILSLLPLAVGPDARAGRALLALFAVLLVTRVAPTGFDLRYPLFSVEVLAFLAFACAVQWRNGRSTAQPAT